jgi:hypothetical protein
MFESRGRWLYCDSKPRVWFSRSELEATEDAPSEPLEEWSDAETLSAMFEAIERRCRLKEASKARN